MSTDRISALGGGIFGTPPRHKAPSTPRPPRERERTQFDAKSPTSSKNSETHCDESNGDECFHESSSLVSTPQLETEEFHSQTSVKTPIDRKIESKVISLDEAIVTEEHRKLLDKIDKLRALGVNKILALPHYRRPKLRKIIGPGSLNWDPTSPIFWVMYTLRNGNLTSPFSLPQTCHHNNQVGIRPSLYKFLEILNQASDDMRVPRSGQRPTDTASNERAFSDHLLSLELSGPQHAQFSVIDLPGLIRSVANQQRYKDIDLIKKMNLRYIEYKRSIILAVLSANLDAANQEVLQLVKDIEQTGRKALGILTKPDGVEAGGKSRLSEQLGTSQIEAHIQKIDASLREIGNPRTSTLEQKLFVTEVEVKAREITDETFHGHYEKEIFIECENLKLRQHARALNKELSEAFIKYGNNRAFSSVLNSRNNEKGDGSEYNRTGRFIPIPREDHGILQWIEQTEASSRGYELPSLTSAYIHSRLFKDITANWEPIAEYYFQQLRGIITRFHDTIMGRTCVDEKCAKGFLAGTTGV
ncbi:hypothetical protein TWF225_001929 [Orbilia oligospora]|nr:hypothetical protein TWF751_011589 [Orbilia oligospora]KAF3190967.1 hypothetical protein TWF225_001929 [Orbilia oligospora]